MSIRRGLMAQMAGSGLPSFLTKLDGGRLALEQNISNATFQVEHSLGETPKGIIVFRYTGDITNASTEAGIIWAVWIYNPTGSTGAWIKNSISYTALVGVEAGVGVQSNVSAGIRNITNLKFDIYATSSRPLLADKDYYWLAWN